MTAPAITVVVLPAAELLAGDVVVIGEHRGPVTRDPILERGRIVSAFVCQGCARRHPLGQLVTDGVTVEVEARPV